MSTLVNRNVTVSGHRTSMRLEPAMWEALEEICTRENLTIHAVCSLVDARRTQSSLTAAMRVFILGYFRASTLQAEQSPRSVNLNRAIGYVAGPGASTAGLVAAARM
ncbi:MAG: ribbon-helix-helix domain-containing protein [Alphaproteobacteria bacterium]